MSLRLVAVPASLVLAVAAASDPQGKTEVTGGVGTGSYAAPYGCGGMVRVPYREAGVGMRHRAPSGLVTGLEASARDDLEDQEVVVSDDGDPPAVRRGARFRVSPWVGYHGPWFRGSLGLVATDYLDPLDDAEHGGHVLPRGTLGVGPSQLHVDLGLFDTPNALAASSDGGTGIISLRVGSEFGPEGRHHLVGGIGGGLGDGYVAGSMATRFDNDLVLGAGGFLGAHETHGLFVTAGMAFWR